MKHKKLTQDRVVYFINYVMLAVFLIIVLYPLIYIISCSFSSGDALMSGKVKLFPVEPTLQSIVRYLSIRVYGRDIGTRLFIHSSEQSSVWFLHCLQLTLFPVVISGGRRYSR